MKQTVVLAVALTLAGVSAQSQQYRRALARRGIFAGDSTTNISSGPGGAGGKARGGKGGKGGKTSGHKNGKQTNTGGNGGTGDVTNDMSGANINAGINGGNAAGGTFSGSVVNNAGAPYQFGGGMFDKGPGGPIYSNSGIGNIASGGSANAGGTNNAKIGGLGDNNGNGGKLGGDQTNSGNQSANGGKGGKARGGAGGMSYTGGGNKGGDGGGFSASFSPTLSVPVKRSLERRALELEEEYNWILQQKREIDEAEMIIARWAEPQYEEEYLEVRSEDPEAEMFYAREADFEDEDVFDGLTARDIYDSYVELATAY